MFSRYACFLWGLLRSLQRANIFLLQESKQLEKQQDSLKIYAYDIVNAEEPSQRFRADSFFIRMLVRSLKFPNSFYFPFDSLQTISKLYAPDSSFRIFTWQIKKDAYVFLQRGAIQMRTADGSLKLFPLHDVSMFSKKPYDSVRLPITGSVRFITALFRRVSTGKIFIPCSVMMISLSTAIKNGWRY